MCLSPPSPVMSRWLKISVGKHGVISLRAPKTHLKETLAEVWEQKKRKEKKPNYNREDTGSCEASV